MTLTAFILSLYLVANISMAGEPHPDCVAWFNREKIGVGTKDCELKCSMRNSDMATFMCSDQCEELCKIQPKDSLLAKFVFYPGLNPAEKRLVAKHPKQAYIVYQQKGVAEDSTDRNFPNQDLNDESDAFRHFVWAGLLTKELGRERANEFLEAHEANPLQSKSERQMDQFNNGRGQSTAETLTKSNNWSLRNLETQGLEELRNNQLQVLSSGLPIPKEPK